MPVANRQPLATTTGTSPTNLASLIARTPPKFYSGDNPLWKGPCGEGPLGGITQSMLVRFLSCRERFRLKYVFGLEPHDRWNHRLGYGNMWHLCEEAFASDNDDGTGASVKLLLHTNNQISKYPLQRDEITKWYNVCRVQFPEYVKYWAEHPDVKNRTPLMQEQVFDVPYTLPSGRVVRLRGKFDSVDVIDGGLYLQENKTKGDIDKQQIERQLKFDLQTMMYLVALDECQRLDRFELVPNSRIKGVRYNVVRRPLSGGKGNIVQHEATRGSKCPKCKGTGTVKEKMTEALYQCPKCNGSCRIGAKPAEEAEHYFERLRRDYIAKEPEYWFFRVRSEVSRYEVSLFRHICLDPLLEQLCWWYDEVTGNDERFKYIPPMNYRTPFGVWSALEEGGATEYDSYLETGSEAGLRRIDTLFPELQDAV
jgi:ribosomal protein L37AE/L43A